MCQSVPVRRRFRRLQVPFESLPEHPHSIGRGRLFTNASFHFGDAKPGASVGLAVAYVRHYFSGSGRRCVNSMHWSHGQPENSDSAPGGPPSALIDNPTPMAPLAGSLRPRDNPAEHSTVETVLRNQCTSECSIALQPFALQRTHQRQ